MYNQIPLEGDECPRASGSRFVKVGIALGLASLLFLSFVALSAHNSDAQSTSLLALGASRSLTPQQSLAPLASLPGPSPWKELALAGLEASNRCDRDISSNANTVKKVYASLPSAQKAVVRAVGAEVIKKGTDMKAGQIAPMGFFDPLGFATDASPGRLLFLREAEIKHGRVCMLASVGYIYGELFHPFFGGNLVGPSYKWATYTDMNTFWLSLAAAIALPEIFGTLPAYKGFGEMKEDRIPGDYGFDPLELKGSDAFPFLEMQNKELSNGRLAMLAIFGMYAQEIATGKELLQIHGL